MYEQSSTTKTSTLLKQPSVIIAMITFSCFLWGSAFPALKIAYSKLGVKSGNYLFDMQFAGYRFFVAALLLMAYMIIIRQPIGIKKGELKSLAILGFFQTSLQYFLFYVGLSNTSGVNGSIVVSSGTFFAVILPHFFFKDDKMNFMKVAGLLLGFMGVVSVTLAKGSLSSGFSFMGEGVLVISSFIGSAAAVYAKTLSKAIKPLVMNFYSFLTGSIMLICLSFVLAGGNIVPMTWSFLPILTYLGFISSAAFTLYYLLLKYNKMSVVSIHKFQVPIWGSILSILLVPGESFTLTHLLALICVSAGILLVSRD